MLDIDHIRSQFPIFANRPNTIFFDNAATAQCPQSVIDAINSFYTHDRANAGRSSYQMSTSLRTRIEEARARVAKFIGAEPEDICFTGGATESLNLIPLTWGLHNLKTNDEVILCLEDHESAVLPWFALKDQLRRQGTRIKLITIRMHADGDYELRHIAESKSANTKLMSMTHIHHLYGLDMEVNQIRQILGKKVLISLDASQSIGHRKVNVNDLQVDFLSFGGHKMFAGNGIGVLWVKPSLRKKLKPLMVGGGMKVELGRNGLKVSPDTLANLLESGSQNTPGILSLAAAVDFIESIGLDAIETRVDSLTKYIYAQLKTLPGIEFSPGVDRCNCAHGYGVISFRFTQAKTADVAALLSSNNILVRANSHCAFKQHKGDSYIRISLHVYNSEQEAMRLIEVLRNNL
jgi:cysteine desulfurase / selenocysteine lyase